MAFARHHRIEGFQRARRLGVGGLATDLWLTADGTAVCDQDGRTGGRLVRRPIARSDRAGLPAGIPSLDELYGACGTGFDLAVDIRAAGAAAAAVGVARSADPGAPKRLWLVHGELPVLSGWREEFPDVRLVYRTTLRHADGGLERRVARLPAAGIDGVALHATEWTGGHVALVHRFDRLALAWDAQHQRVIRDLARMGVDAVTGDHPDRLVAALGG